MKRKFGEYVRIARGFWACSSLWRGDGHYLYVLGHGFLLPFKEEYRRFEFLKIQSVTATKTATGTIWAVVFGIIALVSTLLAIASITAIDGSPSDPAVYVVAGILVVIAMISLAIVATNIALGPTCAFRIQTNVRGESIRPVSRWRSAQSLIATMQAEIELAQAGALRSNPSVPAEPLVPEEVPTSAAAGDPPPPEPPPVTGAQ